jgi:hypothetical protein
MSTCGCALNAKASRSLCDLTTRDGEDREGSIQARNVILGGLWRGAVNLVQRLSNQSIRGRRPHVVVEGEDGLIAEILRYAYASGDGGMPPFIALLIDQTDDCLSRIEKVTNGCLSAEVQQQLLQIAENINELNLTNHVCALNREAVGLQ